MLRTRKEKRKIPLLQNSIKNRISMLCSPKKKFSTAKFSQMYPRVGLIMKKSGFETYFIIGPTLIFMIEPTLP